MFLRHYCLGFEKLTYSASPPPVPGGGAGGTGGVGGGGGFGGGDGGGVGAFGGGDGLLTLPLSIREVLFRSTFLPVSNS
jgi:hypothetical protein